MAELKHLMSPITIRGRTFPNRITSAPSLMSIMMRPDGTVTTQDWLEQKIGHAKGGIGTVCIGETDVDTVWGDRWNVRYQMENPLYRDVISTIYTDFSDLESPKFNTWQKIAREIHNNGGLAMVQLAHPGNMRIGLGSVPADVPVAIGPMGYIRPNGEIVKRMDEEDMRQVCDSFSSASLYMKKAGFDGVQIHGAHGWLLAQFMSKRTNQRNDEYGGSIENRNRFPVRVIKAVRKAVGDDFVLEMRISGQETGVPDGYGLEQSIALARELDGILDILHVSNGHYNRHRTSKSGGGTMYDPHIVNLDDAATIKSCVKHLYLNTVGGVNSPEQADRAIAEGKTDFVSMAKQIYADVNFANKCASGRPEDIQRCCRCMYCGGLEAHDQEDWEVTSPPHEGDGGISERLCTVNPERGAQVPEGGWPAVTAAKKVLVIGGGVAGMMAAITAKDRGHIVTLVEKSDRLGGMLNFTDNDRFKADLMNYKNLLVRRVGERTVKVLLGTEADGELISRLDPDKVVIAVGSRAKRLDVPGIEKALPLLDVYDSVRFEPGQRVAVLGSDMHAGEAAVWLADQGAYVTMIKLAGARIPNVITDKMDGMKIRYCADKAVEEITDEGVRLSGGELVPADAVVWYAGREAIPGAADALKAAAGGIPVEIVGDCKLPRDCANAIRDGYVAAMSIC